MKRDWSNSINSQQTKSEIATKVPRKTLAFHKASLIQADRTHSLKAKANVWGSVAVTVKEGAR